MKKILFILFAWFFLIGTANAATWYTVRKDQGGYMSMVTGYKSTSGQTLFEIDSRGGLSVYVTNTSTISGSGVSQLQSSTSGYIVVYNASTGAYGVSAISGASITSGTQTIINSELPDPITTPEIRTEAKITGKIYIINLTGNPVAIAGGKTGTTISGASVYGGWTKSGTSAQIGNATMEVTAIMTSAVKGMSHVFRILQNTAQSGGTVNVLFEAGDNIASQTAIIAGTSKYVLSGTTNATKLVLTASGTSVWEVDEVGSPTVSWD
uniref:Uncharacterized protein n=1 Tax=viral metagenome TaxID=1070528 RepID=A0A6H1ZL57_9ZZZZ